MLCESRNTAITDEMPAHVTPKLGQPTTDQSSINQILSLPAEVLLAILKLFQPSEFKLLEKVCKRFNELVGDACKIWCRRRMPQQPRGISQNWRAMAFIIEKFLDGMEVQDYSPSSVMNRLLHELYLFSDADLDAEAQECLIALNQQTTREPQWYNALATACMSKKWHDEAKKAYVTFRELGGELGEDTWLTAARFGWSDQFPTLPRRSSVHIKEQSMFGAVAAGDLRMVKELHSAGVSYDVVYKDTYLPTIAAEYGHKSILLHLHQQGIDVIGSRHGKSTIWQAAINNCVDVASFLLELGADPQLQSGNASPFSATLIYGSVDVLRLFIQFMPALKSATNLDGELLMRCIFESHFNKTKRIDIIKCLVTEAGIDINTKGKGNDTALHFAISQGDIVTFILLHSLGADLNIENDTGQTPLELAVSTGHEELTSTLIGHSNSGNEIFSARKRALALGVIASRRSLFIQAQAPNFPGITIQEKKANAESAWVAGGIEDQLAEKWIGAFSTSILQRWHDMLGGEVDSLILEFHEVCVNAMQDLQPTAEEKRSNKIYFITRQIVDIMSSSHLSDNRRDDMCGACMRLIESRNLQKLWDFYNGNLGSAMAAGSRRLESAVEKIFLQWWNQGREMARSMSSFSSTDESYAPLA